MLVTVKYGCNGSKSRRIIKAAAGEEHNALGLISIVLLLDLLNNSRPARLCHISFASPLLGKLGGQF